MSDDVQSAVSARRRHFSSALLADGYELVVDRADAALTVRIVALDGAGEECLLPPDLMARTLSGALGGEWPPEHVQLTYVAG